MPCFASEAQMDRLAAALDIDPVELRLLNAIEPGDMLPTGQTITGSFPVAEVIRRAAALEPPEPEELPRDPLRLPGGSGNTTHGQGVRRVLRKVCSLEPQADGHGIADRADRPERDEVAMSWRGEHQACREGRRPEEPDEQHDRQR